MEVCFFFLNFAMCTYKIGPMSKKIFTFIFAFACVMVSPLSVGARQMIEITEADFQQPSISITGNTIRVSNANGQTLYIYNVAGVRVKAIKIEGADKRFDLGLPKGCYIVKVGKVVRKISISY